MSINKSGSQLYFEGMFTVNNGVPFQNVPNSQYEKTFLTKKQADDLGVLLENEIASYYYKALLSYVECIPALENRLYSWATIRLYYSVFYSIKAYLACNNIAILRSRKKLFYVKAKENECIKKCEEHTDHKGTILTLCKLFKNDMLLSNNIDDMDVYQWMMKRREEVNYKDMDFHDPEPPEFWECISREVEKYGITALIDKLVNDNWLLCFQNEYAILGVPTKRIILTLDQIHRLGKQLIISNEKRELIDSMTYKLSDNSIYSLEYWKRKIVK